MKPQCYKAFSLPLGGIKQFSQALLGPKLQHQVSPVLQSHQTPFAPPCKSCGQLKDQEESFLTKDVLFSFRCGNNT